MKRNRIQIVRDIYAALNRNDVSGYLSFFAANVKRFETFGSRCEGLAELQTNFSQGRDTWAEGSCEAEQFTVVDNKVIAFVHVKVRQKNKTEWIDGQVTDVFVFEGDQVVEFNSFSDRDKAITWAHGSQKPQNWFIVGLGWLGEALRTDLQTLGHQASGTHRSDFDFLHNDFPTGDWEVVFLNTPPITTLAPRAYAAKLSGVTARRVIFISSTSVYGSKCGEVTEADAPSPDAPGGQWLAEVEQELRALLGDRLLIIRPGGLIGGKRHPVFHLQNRVGVSGGNERVNLIHRDDLISIIRTAPASVKLINAIAPMHPRKDDYYTLWANKFGLTPPQFVDIENATRVIQSSVLPEFYSHWIHPELDI